MTNLCLQGPSSWQPQTRQFPRPVAVAKTESTASWPIWIRSIFSANVFSPNAESLQLQSRKKQNARRKKTWPRKHSQHKAFFSKELQLASIVFWWFSCCFRTAFLENQLHDPTSFPATHTTRWPPWWYGGLIAVWKPWLIFDCNLVKRKCFPRLPISCLSKESHQSERIIIVRTFAMNEFQFTNITPLFILMLRSCCQGKNGAPETASLGIP